MMAEEQGHILVVDDNRMNRIKLSRSLEQQGHTVSLAEDGQQALDMLKAQSFDVVLLDIIMPGMDGYQVLESNQGRSRAAGHSGHCHFGTGRDGQRRALH